MSKLALSGQLDPATWGRALELTALALIAYGLYQNRHIKGLWLVALGFFLNTLAILSHGGHMPVSAAALEKAGIGFAAEILKEAGDGLHVIADPQNPLSWLGDVIPLRHQVISVGDILITVGIAIATYQIGLMGKLSR